MASGFEFLLFQNIKEKNIEVYLLFSVWIEHINTCHE